MVNSPSDPKLSSQTKLSIKIDYDRGMCRKRADVGMSQLECSTRVHGRLPVSQSVVVYRGSSLACIRNVAALPPTACTKRRRPRRTPVSIYDLQPPLRRHRLTRCIQLNCLWNVDVVCLKKKYQHETTNIRKHGCVRLIIKNTDETTTFTKIRISYIWKTM